MKKIPCQLDVDRAGRIKEKLGAVAKYYIGDTFVAPTHCCF